MRMRLNRPVFLVLGQPKDSRPVSNSATRKKLRIAVSLVVMLAWSIGWGVKMHRPQTSVVLFVVLLVVGVAIIATERSDLE